MEYVMESDLMLYRLAEVAARIIERDPQISIRAILQALDRQRARRGDHPVYQKIESAARGGSQSLIDLLLAHSDEATLVRSMIPLYAIVPRDQRNYIFSRRPEPIVA